MRGIPSSWRSERFERDAIVLSRLHVHCTAGRMTTTLPRRSQLQLRRKLASGKLRTHPLAGSLSRWCLTQRVRTPSQASSDSTSTKRCPPVLKLKLRLQSCWKLRKLVRCALSLMVGRAAVIVDCAVLQALRSENSFRFIWTITCTQLMCCTARRTHGSFGLIRTLPSCAACSRTPKPCSRDT